MTELEAWFARQAERESRAVLLEDALIGGRPGRYLLYRLRFWLARYALASAVQLAQILVLHRLFPREGFLTLVGLLAGAALLTAAWWGALERLRTRVRECAANGAPHRISAEIGRWLAASIRIGILGIAIAAAFLAWRVLVAPFGLGPVDVAAAAILTRVAIDVPRRCYHSGIYALRRVYRPLPSILAIEVATVGLLVVLAPLIGVWAVPVAEVVAMAVVTAISVTYTARAYRIVGLAPHRHLAGRGSRARTRSATTAAALNTLRSAIVPAFAAVAMSLDTLIAPAVFGAVDLGGAGWTYAILIAAVAPSIRAGFDWSQLLYFDLMRLGARPFAGLRRRFVQDAARFAPLLAVAFWLVSGGLGAIVLGRIPSRLMLTLLPFFVAASFLALAQIEAFTAGAYGRAIAGGGTFGVGLAAIGPLGAVGVDAGLSLDIAAMTGLGVILVLGRLRRGGDEAAGGVLLPAEWLHRLGETGGSVGLASARLGPAADVRTAEEVRRGTWLVRDGARRLARRLGHRGAATAIGFERIAWFERLDADRAPVGDGEWFLRAFGGRLRDVRTATADGGPAAIAVVAAWGILGRIEGSRSDAPASLLEAFATTFPSGVAFAPDRPPPPILAAMSARERRSVLAAATRFARGQPPIGRTLRHDVTAYAPAGIVRSIFLVDRSTAGKEALTRWRRVLRSALLQSALEAAPGAAPPGRILTTSAREPVNGGAAVDSADGGTAASRQQG